jgi:hypothetical protein
MVAAVALGAACSSSSGNGATNPGGDDTNSDDDIAYNHQDGGTDATLDACPVQSLPVNSAACPATYSISYAGQACSPAGTQCWYPGFGDFGANGCPEAATLLCEFADSGLGEVPDAAIFDDAGDASVGYWVFGQ